MQCGEGDPHQTDHDDLHHPNHRLRVAVGQLQEGHEGQFDGLWYPRRPWLIPSCKAEDDPETCQRNPGMVTKAHFFSTSTVQTEV